MTCPGDRRHTHRLTRALPGALATILAATAGAQGAQPASTPRALVERALGAMGGEAAARAVRGRQLDFVAINFALGQEQWPEGPMSAAVTDFSESWDYAGGRRVSTQNVPGVARQRVVVTPAGGMTVRNDTTRLPAAPAFVTAFPRQMRQLAPERLLVAALAPDARLTPLARRAWRGRTLAGARYVGTLDTLDLWFDTATGRLAATETTTDDPVLGERRSFTAFTRWRRAAGEPAIELPHQMDVFVNDRLVQTSTIRTLRVNPPLDEAAFAAPDSILALSLANARHAGARPSVTLAELAPGVYHVTGGSHNSLAVVQDDGIVLVEAPQSDDRVRAVLDTLRARFPGKRMKLAVATHHHSDHIGGVRAAFAAGLPLAAHRQSAAYLRRVGIGATYAARDARRAVQEVADSVTVGAGDTRVLLFAVSNSHADGMLAAYVPAARILFAADIAPGNPFFQRELIDAVRARGLQVERLAPAHGAVTPWETLVQQTEQAVGR